MKKIISVVLEYAGRGILICLLLLSGLLYVYWLGHADGAKQKMEENFEVYSDGFREGKGAEKTLLPSYEKGYDEGYRQGFMHGVDAQGYGKGFREAYREWMARCETWREEFPEGHTQ